MCNTTKGVKNTIGGGDCNCIEGSSSFIGGGEENYIATGLSFSGIIAGNRNHVCAQSSIIGGGTDNCIRGNAYNSIFGGHMNCIVPPVGVEIVHSVIGGGDNNYICQSNSGIFSGSENTNNGILSVIAGGQCNTIEVSTHSVVTGGYENTIVGGTGSFIGGGSSNSINSASSCSFVGSGLRNTSSNIFATVVNGQGNVASGEYSFVGNGGGGGVTSSNQATGQFSFIANGQGNTAAGTHSSILGGTGNTIGAGFSYAAVFGNGVTAVASNTMHIECLNMNALYRGTTPPTGAAFGTVWVDTTGTNNILKII